MPRSCRSDDAVIGPKKPTLPHFVAKLEPTRFPSIVAPKSGNVRRTVAAIHVVSIRPEDIGIGCAKERPKGDAKNPLRLR